MRHVPKSKTFGIPGRKPVVQVVEDVHVPVLRSLTPAQNLDFANEIWCYVRDIFLRAVWEEHPECSFAEMAREVGRRMNALGDD